MDYTQERTTTYEFEMVSPFDLDDSLGFMQGVNAGESSLQWGYYAQLRTTGSLSVVDCDYIANALVRVWAIFQQGDERERIELGTYFVDSSDMTYRFGRWTGTMNLHSTLLRYEDDRLSAPESAAKGSSARARFAKLVTDAGGAAEVMGDVADAAFSASLVWDFGTKVRDCLQDCADAVDGRIDVDPHGRTILERYVVPSSRPVSYTWPSGERSITMAGLGLEDSAYSSPNRFAVKYENDEVSVYAHCDVPPEHWASYENVGRRINDVHELNELDPATYENALAIAQRYRAANMSRTRKWLARGFYHPVRTGQVVRFVYDDGGGSVDKTVMVQQIDMKLTPGAYCEYIFDEVMD